MLYLSTKKHNQYSPYTGSSVLGPEATKSLLSTLVSQRSMLRTGKQPWQSQSMTDRKLRTQRMPVQKLNTTVAKSMWQMKSCT